MQKDLKKINRLYFTVILIFFLSAQIHAQENLVSVDWNKVEYVSKTTPTLQVVENPMLRKNSLIHDASFAALKNLGADYVRYVPWFPYTKMAVAELKPPTKTETFWDFTYLDSTMNYFMQA
ncbi:MAG TPA: FUN14 domain-containing protein, partial [Puia sp.]